NVTGVQTCALPIFTLNALAAHSLGSAELHTAKNTAVTPSASSPTCETSMRKVRPRQATAPTRAAVVDGPEAGDGLRACCGDAAEWEDVDSCPSSCSMTAGGYVG